MYNPKVILQFKKKKIKTVLIMKKQQSIKVMKEV